MAPRRRRAVVPDGDRQEVEHQVGIGDVVVAPYESSRLEVIRRAPPHAEEQPLGANERPPPRLERRSHRDRLPAGVLDVDLQVVLQVLPDSGEVVHDVDAQSLQLVGVADARDLEEPGGVDGAAAQDDVARTRPAPCPRASRVLDADSPLPTEQDPRDERPRLHRQVRPPHDGVQVGAGGAQATATVDGAIEGGEALLPVAVDVVREWIAGLLHRGEERLEQRARGRSTFENERAVMAAERAPVRQAGLHPLEVRQAVGVVPRLHAGVGSPALVIQRVAALEDHPIDAARSAEHLPAGVVDLAPVHERFRFRLVLPVVEPAADGIGQGGGHVDEDVERVVRPAGLQHQDPGGRVGAEPVRERAARGAAADDDEVSVQCAHGTSSHVVSAPPDAQ